ncbi:MAG: hypothetical protein COV47_05750 [Candidatus Diapherotrites archaeon CG11_big_fil_rev_8_21_14_0_20_37_9]|nr:MAG: hypothetical protein COV47_05750 [Candidatus Diapherotrites archaeon CG11_big_fil_rev_8_21_14_0_20_37_9]
MDVAIIAEQQDEQLKKLQAAFKEKSLTAEFIEVGSLGIFVEKNVSMIYHESRPFSEYDSVFIDLPLEFTLFAEPFLSELVDAGIYCPMKPNSFYVLSNKPFLYSTLSMKKVKITKTDILADKETVDSSLEDFAYPLIVKTFLGLKKTNSVLIESERSLRSFIKSISVSFDAITIQEYIEGDVDQSIVIGDDVYTIKRKWVEKELAHSKKPLNTKLADHDKETAIKAVRVAGLDIGVVKMIQGKVIGVRKKLDLDLFSDALSINMYHKIAVHYAEKVHGGKV